MVTRMAEWQPQETATPAAFAAAGRRGGFTTDAGKVNTLEEGWKDLKIASFQKRPRAEPATPRSGPAANCPNRVHAWPGRRLPCPKQFRRTWRRWSRRLGVGQTAELHVLGDGATGFGAPWTGFTGSQQRWTCFTVADI